MFKERLIIVRGGGDIATGTIHRLYKSGFKVLVLETRRPTAVRRQVAFCEAIYEGSTVIEGITGVRVDMAEEGRSGFTEKTRQKLEHIWKNGQIPILIDPKGESIYALQPDIVIDAILAKRNLGTRRDMAPLTIGFGPGFTAGEDVDLVIETMRGHNLGRVITKGKATANTGVPGNIGGFTTERVIRAPKAGSVRGICKIGDVVKKGDVVMMIDSEEGQIPVRASISGLIRGMIHEGSPVTEGFKVGDIDPRKEELKNCFTISDKARCIAGGVLEAVCAYYANLPCKSRKIV